LSSEHRAAPAAPPVYLELVVTNAQTAHLEVVAAPSPQKPASLAEKVLALLTDGLVLTRAKLRELLGVKNERLGQTLEALERGGNSATRQQAGNGQTDAGRLDALRTVPVPP